MKKKALARNIKYGIDTMDCNNPESFFDKTTAVLKLFPEQAIAEITQYDPMANELNMLEMLKESSDMYTAAKKLNPPASLMKKMHTNLVKSCGGIKVKLEGIYKDTVDHVADSQLEDIKTQLEEIYARDIKTQLEEIYARSIMKKYAEQMDCSDTKDIIEKFGQIFSEIPHELLAKHSPDFDTHQITDVINQYEEVKSYTSPIAKAGLQLLDAVFNEVCKTLQSEIHSYYNDEL